MEVSDEVDDDNDSKNDGDVPWFGRKLRKYTVRAKIYMLWRNILNFITILIFVSIFSA